MIKLEKTKPMESFTFNTKKNQKYFRPIWPCFYEPKLNYKF